jgi:sugar-specific transcriptional regulator TrmB
MLPEETILLKTFSRLVNGFGANHAKIYWLLIPGLHKSARQICSESKLAKNTVYTTLFDLSKKRLICFTESNPKRYYSHPLWKTVRRLVRERKMEYLEELETILVELKFLTKNNHSTAQEFLLRIDGKKTELINFKTKQPLEYKHEIAQIKEFLEKVPTKTKEKAWQTGFR